MKRQLIGNAWLLAVLIVTVFTLNSVAFAAPKVVVIPLGGSLKMYWQGEWSAGTNYRVGDGVQSDGSSYVCVTAHSSTATNSPPSNSWDLLAAGISRNQSCPERSRMTGIDASGDIICVERFKYIFVTSSTHKGNLGGVIGADTTCQDLASNAGLPGRYKAWISTYNNDYAPATVMTRCDCEYRRPDGEVVAADWADIVDGQIQVPISVDEKGLEVPPSYVWTGTGEHGVVYDTVDASNEECASWKSQTGGMGWMGWSGFTSSGWTSYVNGLCSLDDVRLYCIEQ